jgi:hypothetical protein
VVALLEEADEQLIVETAAVGAGFVPDDFLHASQKITSEKIRI